MQKTCCVGVHAWTRMSPDSDRVLIPVLCADYVLALETLVSELGGSPQAALASVLAGMAGRYGTTPDSNVGKTEQENP